MKHNQLISGLQGCSAVSPENSFNFILSHGMLGAYSYKTIITEDYGRSARKLDYSNTGHTIADSNVQHNRGQGLANAVNVRNLHILVLVHF